MTLTPDWKPVSFSADCDEDGNCSIYGLEYSECECPGPTQDGIEYIEIDGVLYGKEAD